MEYFIPSDSSELFRNNGLQARDVDNFSLRFNRFTKKDFNEEKRKYEFNLRDVHFSFDKQIDKVEKQQNFIKQCYQNHNSITVENNWRLAIGIGSASVYETSISLHHIYGIPFIPAQSIKGSFRSYIIENYFESGEENAFEDEGFVTIFGSNDKQGKVIFFDAFTKESEIKIDIMNNHYQPYYNPQRNKNPNPVDTHDPNPVNFMTLKNAKFEITIATKENIKINEGLFKYKDTLAVVKEELSNSLESFGIGAKTAVGYGYFEVKKSEDEKEWNRIKNSKNIKDFDKFIKGFSESNYIAEAEKKKKLLLQKIENNKNLETNEKIKQLDIDVKKAWDNIHNPQYKDKLQNALQQFIKKWSKNQKNKGSESVLDYVERAKNELK